MDFRNFGSLEVWDGERQLELGGSKRRAVLALLLLRANEVVAVDRLVDQLWGEKAPRNASAAIRTHVSRLRKELGPEVVVTRAWGYVLRTEPGALDLERFERLTADAESLPARERAGTLREALALWRGPPLADLSLEPGLALDIARLEELRLSVLEDRIDADLEAGNQPGLVGELEAMVAEQPMRERLRGQLILALYRSGRQAEALEVYRETRHVLVEELGIEPSPDLKELERAILRQDPALASAPAPLSSPREQPPPPGRWRWPRSPLALGATLLALALAGAALTVARTPAASTSTKPQQKQVVTEDAFENGVLDPRLWDHETSGNGVGQAEQNGRLEMWFGASASLPPLPPGIHGTMEARAWTQCRFTGNCDASVDYRLLHWPAANGVIVLLEAGGRLYGKGPNAEWTSLAIDRVGLPPNDAYAAWHPANWNRVRPTTAMQGALRIKRVGRTLSAYYKAGQPLYYKSRWVWLASYQPPGKIRPLVLFLEALSPEGSFAHRPVRIAFDDFFISADASTCS